MIILHLVFARQALMLWGEIPEELYQMTSPEQKTKRGTVPSYPYGASHGALLRALLEMQLNFSDVEPEKCSAVISCPVFKKKVIGSHPLIAPWPEEAALQKKPDAVSLKSFQVPAIRLTPSQANALLSYLAQKAEPIPGVMLSKDMLFWGEAIQFVNALLEHQRVLPTLKYQSGCYWALWEPLIDGPWLEAFNQLAQSMPHVCRSGMDEDVKPPHSSLSGKDILMDWLKTMIDYRVRQTSQNLHSGKRKTTSQSRQRQALPSDRMPTISTQHGLHDGWLKALSSQEGMIAAKQALIEPFHKTLEDWQSALTLPRAAPYQLCLRLEEPENDDSEQESPWFLRVMLQSRHDPSLLLTPEQFGNKVVKQHFQKENFNPQTYLLIALGQASRVWPVVDIILQQKRMTGCWLETQETFTFLTQYVTLLEESGIKVLLPSWWNRKSNTQKLAIRANVKSPKMKSSGGMSLEQLVEFDWQVALGEKALSIQELEALAQLKQPLVRMRGQWVQMNPVEIQAALDFLKKKRHDSLTLSDVIRTALGADIVNEKGVHFEGVKAQGWVGDLLKQLETQSGFVLHKTSKAFQGELRPYQQRGYSWLMFLKQWGLGACLADDMGLGKTVQTLAMIQKDYTPKSFRPVLLVCPTSVVGNWQKETARFAPELPVLLHHGPQRLKGKAFEKAVAKQAIVITSYALLHRDDELLKKICWQGLILDEAQNIKNSETKQAQAARNLKSDYRLALTGTPVENSVGDLWSIMQFLNPGFLGSQAAFQRRFFNPIQRYQDETAREQLKRLTGPFILRRLKTDKSIIQDLPDKMEMKTFCTLTTEQASLYTAVLNEAELAIAGTDGIERKGVILALITKLKQICNHPAHFLKDHSALESRSGKLTRLCEMLEEIQATGEKTLIFTQFSEMGTLLQEHLQNTFGQEVLFLHGGVVQKKRQQMIERFQSLEQDTPQVFILSLKAGGTGLNLTAANHVFHFDRWWNPAVENQATDRAFRIGQTRQVQVHKFVCVGTFEERIDELIERKQALAEQVVGTGEQWLTELSNEALKSLFALQKETVGV